MGLKSVLPKISPVCIFGYRPLSRLRKKSKRSIRWLTSALWKYFSIKSDTKNRRLHRGIQHRLILSSYFLGKRKQHCSHSANLSAAVHRHNFNPWSVFFFCILLPNSEDHNHSILETSVCPYCGYCTNAMFSQGIHCYCAVSNAASRFMRDAPPPPPNTIENIYLLLYCPKPPWTGVGCNIQVKPLLLNPGSIVPHVLSSLVWCYYLATWLMFLLQVTLQI